MDEMTEGAVRRKARLAGLFYALDIVTGALSLFLAGKGLGVVATSRNWTTVTKLLELADG